MALPSTVTTNLYPDFKSAVIGPAPRILQDKNDTGAGTLGVGDFSSRTALNQTFTAGASGPLASVDVYVVKVGSPTDNLVLTLRDASGNVLATGKPIAGALLALTASYRRVSFPSPFSVVSGTAYELRMSRSGAVNSSNYFRWGINNANPYAGGKLQEIDGSDVATDVSPASDARFKANVSQPGRYVFAVDKSANKIRCYKTTDNETWTEQDSANAPAVSSTANLKSCHTIHFDSSIAVFIITSSTRLDIFHYNTATDAWGSSVFNATNPTFNVNASGVAPMVGLMRPVANYEGTTGLADTFFTNNGATESVMGQPRRRVKISRRLISDGTWNTPYDVVGSGFTPDATLPGTAVDYDCRSAVVLGTGNVLVFWTQSDDSSIRLRMLSGAGSPQFQTTTIVGSPAAVITNTAAYPMGHAVNFFKSPNWWVAFPYVDSGVLKVARAQAASVNAAGNWTLTTVTTATIEVTTSNPAVLVPDNENGGKLFVFFTKTDGKLYYSHDQGTDTWVEAQEFRPGTKTIAGLSAQGLSDALGVAYLDTSPTPDAIKYDQAEVFF